MRGEKWTPEQIDFVTANHLIITPEEIAKKLNRGRFAVRAKITRLINEGKLSPYPDDKWTEEEDKYLKDNYYETPLSEILLKLGRAKQAVYVRAWKLGLEKLIGYTEKQEKLIIGLYKKGHSCASIVKIIGFSSEDTVKRFLRREGLIRSLSEVTAIKADDLSGQKFGKLTAIKRFVRETKSGAREAYWECKCDCGNTKNVRTNSLLVYENISCGCDKIQGFGEISGTYFWRLGFGARQRKLEFNISAEYIWNLFLLQNKKCALSGLPIKFHDGTQKDFKNQTASLDRIDSSKGYIEGNVQWVHKTINRLKLDYKQEDFIYYCDTVSSYQREKSLTETKT